MLETAPVLPVPLAMGCLIPKAKSPKAILSLSQAFPHGPSSPREAVRLLSHCLHGVPQFLGDKECGHA